MEHYLLIFAVVALVGCASISPEQSTIVEKAIRVKLNKPTGELTKADLEKVTKLYLGHNRLTDVKGLEEHRTFKKIKYHPSANTCK